jgi:hypothetical protein
LTCPAKGQRGQPLHTYDGGAYLYVKGFEGLEVMVGQLPKQNLKQKESGLSGFAEKRLFTLVDVLM